MNCCRPTRFLDTMAAFEYNFYFKYNDISQFGHPAFCISESTVIFNIRGLAEDCSICFSAVFFSTIINRISPMERLVILKNPVMALGAMTVHMVWKLAELPCFLLKASVSFFSCPCKFLKSNSRFILSDGNRCLLSA